ncbi:MAG: GGDEF domain-containing protein [Deferribacterales bacterium]
MNKLNNIIRENADLKDEMKRLMELVKENQVKHEAFRMVEFSFLLAESLKEIIEKPLHYIEDIFDVDRAVLFINGDVMDFDREANNLDYRIFFMPDKMFRTFFLEKRPYSSDSRLNLISELDVYEDMESYMIAPLLHGESIIGCLALFSKSAEKFGGEVSTDFVKDLASIASVSVQKLYNTEKIFRQTRTDFLTGTYNKLAMAEFLDSLMAKYKRYGTGFYFLMLDIDNFKQINDTCGHLTGDSVIKEIADEIKAGLRVSDVLGRFGGDEFFMILPNHETADIFTLVERIQDIGKRVFNAYGFTFASLSGGVVAVPGDIAENDTAEDIVRIADGRLYYSKKNGKGFFTGV